MRVAITGSIGAGKSTVSTYLKAQGYPVYNTDTFTHGYYDPKGKLYPWLMDTFGSQILNEDETVNRKALSEIVFNDSFALALLEQQVFSLVRSDILQLNDAPLLFVEVPLLFEAEMEDLFDVIISVDASMAVRYQRLGDRGLSLNQIKKREARQLESAFKNHKADYVIYNDHDLEYLYDALDTVLRRIKDV